MWTAGTYVALALSAAIGLSLGVMGGGGSTITVPILVYIAGLPVPQAIALSLAIVGVTAAVGAVLQFSRGNVRVQVALVFAITGMLGAAFGAKLTPLVPEPVLLLFFAVLMVWVGWRMIFAAPQREGSQTGECRIWVCVPVGAAVGVLTGFLGVGGGFLIVPALLRFAKLPMRQAAGTSLLVIAANSASGFISHAAEMGEGLALPGAFIGVAVAGMFVGLRLARRMKSENLRLAFGWLSVGVAAYLIVMNTGPLVALMRGT